MKNEKRREVRVQPHPAAPIEVQLIGNDFIELLFAKDISITGIGVIVPHKFADMNISGSVKMILRIPGFKSLQVKGSIQHRTGADDKIFGIQFQNLSDQEREPIERYIRKRLHGSPS